jgi:hypothetical protein
VDGGRLPVAGCDRGRGVDQLAGLVLHCDGDLAELVTVLTGVVGAEEQVTASSELDTEVGLGTAPVTAIQRCERRSGSNCSGHLRPLSFLGVLLNVSGRSNSP